MSGICSPLEVKQVVPAAAKFEALPGPTKLREAGSTEDFQRAFVFGAACRFDSHEAERTESFVEYLAHSLAGIAFAGCGLTNTVPKFGAVKVCSPHPSEIDPTHDRSPWVSDEVLVPCVSVCLFAGELDRLRNPFFGVKACRAGVDALLKELSVRFLE